LDRDVLFASSPPDSPFSAFSAPRSPSATSGDQHLMSHLDIQSVSEDDLDILSLHSSVASSSPADDNVKDGDSVWSWTSSTRSRQPLA
jgi:hypothetical protein